MKRRCLPLLLACAALSALFGVLSLMASARAALAAPGKPPRVYFGTRFSALTSEVWRYGATFARRDLEPVANNNPFPEPQPQRDRPQRVALSADGRKLYVTLA